VDQRAWKDIYGPQKGQAQLPKYTRRGVKQANGLFDSPSDEQHARMRKLLTVGFSEKAVRENEGILHTYAGLMIEKMKESKSEETDLRWWFKCLAADLVGRFTFGHDFGGL
jgi:cytochrome P450